MNRKTSKMPGNTPVTKNRAIDSSMATPYTIKIIEGGINKPNVPEPARVPSGALALHLIFFTSLQG